MNDRADEYIVMAVLPEERTAHVYGPFSLPEANIAFTALNKDPMLPEGTRVNIIPKAKLEVDDGAT
jgi:hypothetical protein